MNPVRESRDIVLGGNWFWSNELCGESIHASQGAFRRSRARTFEEGFGGASSRARNRACASSSRKNVRWSRMASSASRRALSSMNSDNFWPRRAAARFRIAFASADVRIWMTSSLRRAFVGMNISSADKLATCTDIVNTMPPREMAMTKKHSKRRSTRDLTTLDDFLATEGKLKEFGAVAIKEIAATPAPRSPRSPWSRRRRSAWRIGSRRGASRRSWSSSSPRAR